jgi:hypothetical protein
MDCIVQAEMGRLAVRDIARRELQLVHTCCVFDEG